MSALTKLTPGWALIRVNFDLIQEIRSKKGVDTLLREGALRLQIFNKGLEACIFGCKIYAPLEGCKRLVLHT